MKIMLTEMEGTVLLADSLNLFSSDSISRFHHPVRLPRAEFPAGADVRRRRVLVSTIVQAASEIFVCPDKFQLRFILFTIRTLTLSVTLYPLGT